MEVDFKVWTGCLLALQKYGQGTNEIDVEFTEFVRLCGYDKSRINKEFRSMLRRSLARLKGLNMSFSKQLKTDADTLEAHLTSLLKTATVEEENNLVSIEVDPELWDLYQIDHEILVSMQNLNLINRAETAQCLYLYLTALPAKPHPILMKTIRERLELSGTVAEQNRRIKTAVKTLSDAGLVKGNFKGARDAAKFHVTEIVRKSKVSHTVVQEEDQIDIEDYIEGEIV